MPDPEKAFSFGSDKADFSLYSVKNRLFICSGHKVDITLVHGLIGNFFKQAHILIAFSYPFIQFIMYPP